MALPNHPTQSIGLWDSSYDSKPWECHMALCHHQWNSYPIVNSRSSLIWKYIIGICPLFNPYLSLVLGNGFRVKFWWGDTLFLLIYPKLFWTSSQNDAFISEIISIALNGISWNLHFSRDLVELEIDYVASLLDSLRHAPISQSNLNRCRWSLEPLDCFSSKSFFKSLKQDSIHNPQFPTQKVWKGLFPPSGSLGL